MVCNGGAWRSNILTGFTKGYEEELHIGLTDDLKGYEEVEQKFTKKNYSRYK